MDMRGIWKNTCEECNQESVRKFKPVVNIYTCCGKTHRWVRCD